MRVRHETAQTPGETGAWSCRERGSLEEAVDRPSGEPAQLTA